MVDELLPYSDLPVSRSEAKKIGARRYFTGKPCRHGHVTYRLTSSTSCPRCIKDRRDRDPGKNYSHVKAWRKLHPDARAEEARRYRTKYPEKVRATIKRYRERHRARLLPIEAEQARKRRKQDPEGNRRRVKAFKERREQVLADIAGRPRPTICDLCHENNGGIVFDHCHERGNFRGWLCDRCNKVLGLVKDSASLLESMARYLENSHGTTYEQKAE